MVDPASTPACARSQLAEHPRREPSGTYISTRSLLKGGLILPPQEQRTAECPVNLLITVLPSLCQPKAFLQRIVRPDVLIWSKCQAQQAERLVADRDRDARGMGVNG